MSHSIFNASKIRRPLSLIWCRLTKRLIYDRGQSGPDLNVPLGRFWNFENELAATLKIKIFPLRIRQCICVRERECVCVRERESRDAIWPFWNCLSKIQCFSHLALFWHFLILKNLLKGLFIAKAEQFLKFWSYKKIVCYFRKFSQIFLPSSIFEDLATLREKEEEIKE